MHMYAGDFKITPNFALEIKQVSKKYDSIIALQNLSFSVHKGEVFGYIGPNGAGKTTTIKILVGLLKNYDGNIFIEGKNIKDATIGYKNLGYLPQECDFQEWRKVKMALMTFGLLSGMPKERILQRIPEVLSQVGLHDVENRKIKNLSGGMKQKLRLAQALLHSPTILILDEPMTGLDPASRFQMKQIIKSLAKQDITILLSSHILSDIEDIADRIGILNHGELIECGSEQELQSRFEVEDRIQINSFTPTSSFDELLDLAVVDTIETISERKVIIKIKTNISIEEALLTIHQKLVKEATVISKFELLHPDLEQMYMSLVGGYN